MNQKYKSPEMMQEKGVDFHTKLLKKNIKAMIDNEEKVVQPFFYNTEFDFGEETHPILYIGEIPNKWKKYLKTNKTSKTFVHGNCLINDEGLLKMQIITGKGGKEPILKDINKILLKPFCSAYFVEEINIEGTPSVIEKEATLATTVDNKKEQNDNAFKNWVNTSKNFLKVANQAIKANLKILNEFEKPLSKLKDIIVTDDFIAKAMKAKTEVIDLDALVLQLTSLSKSGKKYKEADKLLSLLLQQIKQINNNKTKIDLMLKNMEGLKSISNPKDAKIPIINDDPIINFLNRTSKVYT